MTRPRCAAAPPSTRLLLLLVLLPAALALSSSSSDYCGTTSPGAWTPLASNGTQQVELLQVIALFRHGDRMVATGSGPCWQNDTAEYVCSMSAAAAPSLQPFNQSELVGDLFRKKFSIGRNEYNGTCGKGQLTSIGREQHVALGSAYASAYGDWLRAHVPSLHSAYLRSDDVDRTQQSSQSFCSGLIPPNSTSSYNIYDIHTRDESREVMSPNTALCPVLDRLYVEYATQPSVLIYFKKNVIPLVHAISDALGYTVHVWELPEIFDCANVKRCHGMPSPFSEQLYQQVCALFFVSSRARCSTFVPLLV
eukprot:TRINITY_DN3365_c0_g1_i1.p1 TRINITY_DN3365_c0_g1~~TRINITY_DN3365_c0_g1_i1.p1  ORF type:complete len:316 (+),score=96.41 TRINITY_DN3365_c0_g1_i1:27-950(+)